ncbi:MAG: hypothetical protein EPN91_00985 [Salinibacterium sp.]|nr:MAG: hypothetical protein EPN91_00985 [Salinibacterium sp.]
MPRRITDEVGRAVVSEVLAGGASRDSTATAVRYLLQALADVAPGNTVEVRVPPFGAVQAVAGPKHTRGTPPNVVEMDATAWVALATGSLTWDEAVADGRISASGQRSQLEKFFPVFTETGAH